MKPTPKGHYFSPSDNDPTFCAECCYPAASHKQRPKYWVISREEWRSMRDCYGESFMWKHTEFGNMRNAYLIPATKTGKIIMKGFPEREAFDWSKVGEFPPISTRISDHDYSKLSPLQLDELADDQ